MNDVQTARNTRRNAFMEGVTRKGHKIEGETWFKENDKILLDAHHKCKDPGPEVALDDALVMIKSGYAQLTVGRPRKRKATSAKSSVEKDDDEEEQTENKRRKLLPCEKIIVQDFYDEKVEELQAKLGVEEREKLQEDREARVQQKLGQLNQELLLAGQEAALTNRIV